VSGLSLVTGGLFPTSGLSLTTGGLLVLASSGSSFSGTAALLPTLDALLAFDLDMLAGDIAIDSGDLARETTLQTAVLLSLFTDRRATADELARFGGDDARGWWGDELAEVDGDEFGSKLWLLSREKTLPETLNRAREYARQALAWMIEDDVASSVAVEAAWLDTLVPRMPRGILALGIEIVKPTDVPERYALVWAGV
jgi:phage gp46-like protein